MRVTAIVASIVFCAVAASSIICMSSSAKVVDKAIIISEIGCEGDLIHVALEWARAVTPASQFSTENAVAYAKSESGPFTSSYDDEFQVAVITLNDVTSGRFFHVSLVRRHNDVFQGLAEWGK